MAGLWFETALLPEGWARGVRITTRNDLIAVVETDVAAQAGDTRHGIALPGMANLHSHAFQRGMAGLTERRGAATDSFWTWREIMYRFVGAMTPDQLEAIVAQAFVEMLEAGFTRVGEFHYIHHDPAGAAYADPAETSGRTIAAAGLTGIGLTLLPVFYAHAGFGGVAPTAGQRRFVNDVDRFCSLVQHCRRHAATLPGTVVGIAPHSLRAVTPEELAALVVIHADGPVHIHIAEQAREVAECMVWSAQRPVEWLLGHMQVDSRWCLVHATHMTDSETGAMAASGAVAGLCPITEANLGDGVFPARAFRDAGGRYGIGSDSNVLIGVVDELRQLEYSQRLVEQARNVMARPAGSNARALFEDAYAGGHRALGTAGTGLAVGAPADIVSLDAGAPAFVGRAGDELLDSWMFAAGKGVVADVWSAGRHVVRDGRHLAAGRVERAYRRAVTTLLRA